MADVYSYVVRGAKMMCVCGTHKRKINLPVSHGSYVNGKPAMNEDDNKVGKNINYFGVCKGSVQGTETVYLVGEDGKTVSGKKCSPKIIKKWLQTKEDTLVEGKPALTTQSVLICANGGYIGFVSDGQHDDDKK